MLSLVTLVTHTHDNILAQVDAHIGTHVELASHLRLSVCTINTEVKNQDD
jgi:hypothetical protein